MASLLRVPRLLWEVTARGRYEFVYDRIPFVAAGMPAAKRWNLLRSGGNLLWRRAMAWSLPIHMQVEVVNYCNLQCPVCPTGSGELQREPRAMDPDLFERLMREVGPYLLTLSLWAWGEPLLHPQLKEILRACRRYGMATLLSTNGQFLARESVQEALLAEPPAHLIVAVDGLTDETNSHYRKGARLEPLLAGVRLLAEARRKRGQRLPVLHMRFLLMRHNEHEVPHVEAFAREHGFDFLSLRTLSICDSENPDAVHHGFVPVSANLQAYGYRDAKRIRRDDFYCLEPFWFPTVFADGTLVACEQDHQAQQSLGVFGRDGGFSDLWFSRRAARIRAELRDRPECYSFCRNCPYADRPVTDSSIEARVLNPEFTRPLQLTPETNSRGRRT